MINLIFAGIGFLDSSVRCLFSHYYLIKVAGKLVGFFPFIFCYAFWVIIEGYLLQGLDSLFAFPGKCHVDMPDIEAAIQEVFQAPHIQVSGR